MDKESVISNLLSLPEFEPEHASVMLPRLNMVFELQEVLYDKLVRVRREKDAQIHLLLASITNHPEIRTEEWYREHMGCPTPVDALKKLLRMGEVERMCRVIDQLNGYAPGSVVSLDEDELNGVTLEQAVEDLGKN